MSTPAENTRLKVGLRTNSPNKLPNSENPQISVFKHPFKHPFSVEKTKRRPTVFRMLKEDKKEELIKRWLQSSKDYQIKGGNAMSVKATSSEVPSVKSTDSLLSQDSDIILKRSDKTVLSEAAVFKVNSAQDNNHCDCVETASTMSCQVTSVRKGRNSIKKLAMKLQHVQQDGHDDCRTVIMTLWHSVSFSSVVYCIKHVRLVGVLTL